jgi:hypothetical protein
MPTVRLTGFFKDDDGHGWSETHDKDGGSSITSLTTFIANFDTLMKTFRRPLLGGDAFYIGCRGSYRTASGAIAGDNILLDPPLRGPQTFGGQDVNMDAAEVAVKMRLRNDASTARTDVYIRGMWRQIILAGTLQFSDTFGVEWKRRADAYAAALISGGYGWIGTNPTATSRGKVTGYLPNPDGTVTLQVSQTNGVPLPVAGTKLPFKFARINGSKSILNRLLVCTVDTGGTSVTTLEKISPSVFETNGTYIAVVTGFIPYAAQSYYKLAQRKTGRPFGAGRGRLSAQTLH